MKKVMGIVVGVVLAVGLTGCMGTDNRVTVTPQPGAVQSAQPLTPQAGSVTEMPQQSGANGQNNIVGQSDTRTTDNAGVNGVAGMPGNAMARAFDWVNQVNTVTDQLNKISEISQSYVVVDEEDALVGVTFDSAYRGGMTERIRAMIVEQLQSTDGNIDDVYVTDNPEMVDRIKALAEKVADGADTNSIDAEFDAIEDMIK